VENLVGRASERERLDELLRKAVEGRGGALALVGEPGIGKTALLEHARERADGAFRVLVATGAEAEADLPFAALLTLLRPVLDGLAALPAVQRRALEGALAVGPPTPADSLAVHAGALALLTRAAHERPVLVVIDDAHWLDPASSDALLFAARRLEGEPVAMLLALRPQEGRILDLDGVECVTIGALEAAEAAELLHGRGLPAAVVEQLHAATTGNPLALLEAPQHLTDGQRAGREPLGDPIALGPDVQAAFRCRLEQLPQRTRTALLLVAAAGAEPLERIAAAGAELSDLEPAESAGLITLGATEARFRHTLVRAAAYADAPAPERRAAHRALAAHTQGARRAGHLWAAATGADPDAADSLEAAADEARVRTGYVAAALAAERAAQLSATAEERARRLALAAQDRLASGDPARAAELAQAALALSPDPAVSAELLGVLGAIELVRGSLDDGHQRLVEAAAKVAEADPGRAAFLLASAAMANYMAGRVASGLEANERAHALAQRAGGRIEAVVAIMLGGGRILAGQDGGDGQRALLDRWPDAIDETILIPAAPQLAGALLCLGWVERYDDAEAFADRVERLAAEYGAGGALPYLAGRLELDLRRGDWTQARARTGTALRVADATGQVVHRSLSLTVLARLDAAMGLQAECRAAVDELHGFAETAGMRPMRAYGRAALGLLELGLGQMERAVVHLDETARLCEEYGQRDPSVVPYAPDRVEALFRVGEVERAEAALLEFEAMAAGVRRPWPTAAAARCRGLLAAEDAFETCFARAYAAHGESASPFERARTELCHGERLRRARRVTEARERLRCALEAFEALGAQPWAERARHELRAAGGAAGPARIPIARELTPQELEIALAVAAGATNREVASAFYVSPKTVEVHLTRVFRKLGIRSRTELAAVVGNAAE
jgi:DNA-binding CsgD family transcriptional regulator